MRKKSKRGFTLIEVLIVSTMLAVVSLAIYAAFNNGIKIWQRVNQNMEEEDLGIFLERFTADLRNTSNYSGLKFHGEEHRVEFATIVNSPSLNKRTVGGVIYAYDAFRKTLERQELDFSQVYRHEDIPGKQSLENIKTLKFQYYFYDPLKKEYLWLEECQEGHLPLAIRMELEFNHGEGISNFTKTVSLPVAKP